MNALMRERTQRSCCLHPPAWSRSVSRHHHRGGHLVKRDRNAKAGVQHFYPTIEL